MICQFMNYRSIQLCPIVTALIYLLFNWTLFFCLPSLAKDSAFEIAIQRKFSSSECVSGYLLVEGKVICYILERPWLGNIPEISTIPNGRYDATIRTDGAKGWRIELIGVPERANIQIHVGNTPADSKGCLLPGINIDDSLCQVFGSKDAMARISESFKAHEEEIRACATIRVEISGSVAK
jgi:uncharacterized protein DUF5675